MKTKRVLKKIAALSTGVAMLGATLTGALALDYSLADYPSPFVTNGVFSGVMTVGRNAAASDTIGQSVLLADLQTKAVSPTGGTTVTVAGGVSDDIPLGGNVSDGQTYTLDQELADDDIDSLLDSAITFQSNEYDIAEVLYINQGGNAVEVVTSLTGSEDDYQTDIVMEVAKDAIRYYYIFDETIVVNETTSSEPLEVKFLGKTLKITDVDDTTEGKFTATVGAEYFMNSQDSVVVDGKTVKLVRVGSAGAIVIDVDGVQETIPSGQTETVNGIEIKNDETFYDSNNQAASAATLIVGADAIETYKDGDAYVGEDEDDPDWVWQVDNIKESSASTSLDTNAPSSSSGPYFGIENDFIFNDDSDNPPKAGECVDLPNNYISICMDSLTVSDDNYATYTFEFEDSADLSDAVPSLTSEKTIWIHTTQSEGLVIDQADIAENASSAKDIKTSNIWLYTSADANTYGNDTDVGIFYKDPSDNNVKWAGTVNAALNTTAKFAHINYDNTKDTDIGLQITEWAQAGGDLNLSLVPYHSTNLPDYNDNITMRWKTSSQVINSLGDTASSEESSELLWEGTNQKPTQQVAIGNKDEDHRSRYGIIIRDPKSHGASDEVVIDIPGDQVQANVVIKGTTTTTATTGGSVIVNPIPSSAVALSEEVASPSAQNLIVVGGPAVNPLATSVFAVTVADFTPNEAMVKLADNGANVALLVAGYSAVDTRNACEAVADGRLATLNKAEAKVTSATQTVGSYTVE